MSERFHENLLTALGILRDIAFEMPPPNKFTPRLVMQIAAIEHYIREDLAEVLDERRKGDGGET